MHPYVTGLAAAIFSISVQAVAPQEINQTAIPPAHGQAAWILADATTGRIESAHNEQLLLKPASTQKLLTTLAGALALGPDWHYTTQIRYRGKLHNGKLVGDLLIDFVGDPSLTREQLRALLQGTGVRQVSGNVLLNQQRFAGYDRGNGWSWNDLSVCYTSPVSALILDRNCVQGALYARPGQPARATVPSHQPVEVSAAVEVLSRAEQQQRFCELEVEMSPPNRYRLTGCIGPRKDPWPLRFAIQDVDAWGEQLTRWALGQAGVKVSGGILASRIEASDWPVLAHHDSPPLRELSRRILEHSDNLYADSLLRTLGAEHFKQPGSFRNGTQAVRDILQAEAGIDLGPSWLADGSGLSSHNLLRAEDLLAVLLVMAQDPRANWLMGVLPVSGESGTLRYRRSVLGPALKGRIMAKTGTIAHVQNLVGFIDTDGGRRKAFVLLQNGLSISPDHEQNIAAGRGEWPARGFERRWLESVVTQEPIVKTNQSAKN
ncbi:D-alanyl-D-alanine carboxypeptidase/D-alanyl-D-alanine-endopeptidase (penicillin-binding protein 4) [Oceanisphaera litoralis]|uniref:D-alanyl-D-alanine carboxypeptidase/D-alanyl-D-alanine endopeptidase n=1 Tax=Oceanisphaera litoralis TaxID=225144 RepID=UPI00195A3527|nr:D-alanyl-D-alanine carboxypeptidase/D-alanyl-D-alanine-endopeptidase [Oceanisphaera litoralis]MBM7454547.1 D-alanyl-D-alanine carboxypeptidase/D-alanyl-D-alanine-endopeptidase (penicillin-binding protein 4) [Oceanisphaera litoralis]